jgi:predicted aldo/keto reductase-like oxidoreductase
MAGILGQQKALGITGLLVGRLGLGSSLGGPVQLYREAFERGVNYFWWGAVKRYAMRNAIREIVADGKRDKLVVALVTYARWRGSYTRSLERQLRKLNLDHCDVFLAGYMNREIRSSLVDEMAALKERGLCRFLGVVTHERKIVPKLALGNIFDVFHIRYNFAHPGADADLFPHLPDPRPGIVAFRTTDRGKLAHSKRPDGTPVGMLDAFRFAMSNPNIDVVTTDPGTLAHMRENLRLLEMDPMTVEEREEMLQLGRM